MSEHPQASNRHLALTIEQQQQQQQHHHHHTDIRISPATPTKGSRRKRSSTSSNGAITTKRLTSSQSRPEISNATETKKKPGTSYPVRSSSTSSKTMSTVNLTKTGRVSKAKKGLKVHDCECGRSYTRAEHLRRHQRNHAKEEAMVCAFPDCGKTFFRSDLLQRHEERHNEDGRASRQPSVSSTERSTQASPTTVPARLPMLPVSTLPPTPSFSQQQVASPQLGAAFPSDSKHQIPNDSARHSISGPVAVEGPPGTAGWHDSFAHSPYSCSSDYPSPAPGLDYNQIYATPPYINNVVRTRASSNASMIEQHWAQASQSPTSSVGIPYTWQPDEKSIAASGFPYTTRQYSTSDMPMQTIMAPMAHYDAYDPHNLLQMDIEEGLHLFPGDHYGMSQITRTFPSEQRLNKYWRLFHPTFPVVHRFTFDRLEQSPMLYAAMIAIDLYYSNDAVQRQEARELHKACVKLLNRREQMGRVGCDRLCDLQAIFLVEVFAQYCAQRCYKTLSLRFENTFRQLLNVHGVSSLAIHDSQSISCLPEDAQEDCWLQWVKLIARRHLLLSCFILEAQQYTLLGRDRESVLSIPNDNLPFPINESWWGAETASEWSLIAQDQHGMPTTVREASRPQLRGRYDLFQSTVLITAHRFNSNASDFDSNSALQDILSNSSTTQLQYLAAKLVQLLPMRALLAVSGETWVFGTKITSEDEAAALKSSLQRWIGQIWSSTVTGEVNLTEEALHISVSILTLSLETDTRLALGLGNDLGVFLAALVLWAATAAASSRSQVPSQSLHYARPPILPRSYISTTSQPVRSSHTPILATHHQSAPVLAELGSTSAIPLHRRGSVPYQEIISNTSRFLSSAVDDIKTLNLTACHTGSTSALLWARMYLLGIFQDSYQTASIPTDVPDQYKGEIVNGVIGQVGRMLDHEWDDWGI